MGWDTCRHVYIKACFEFVEFFEKKNCSCILQLGEMMCFLNIQNNNTNLPLYPAITFGKKSSSQFLSLIKIIKEQFVVLNTMNTWTSVELSDCCWLSKEMTMHITLKRYFSYFLYAVPSILNNIEDKINRWFLVRRNLYAIIVDSFLPQQCYVFPKLYFHAVCNFSIGIL